MVEAALPVYQRCCAMVTWLYVCLAVACQTRLNGTLLRCLYSLPAGQVPRLKRAKMIGTGKGAPDQRTERDTRKAIDRRFRPLYLDERKIAEALTERINTERSAGLH